MLQTVTLMKPSISVNVTGFILHLQVMIKKDSMYSLGKRIRTARIQAGYTQEDVAEKVGVSRTAVSQWEIGDIEPKISNLIAVAEALNVSTDYLLGIEDGDGRDVFDLSEEARSALKKFIIEVRKKECNDREG